MNICHLITNSTDIMSTLAVSTTMGYINWDFVFLTVIEIRYFLLVCNLYEVKYYHILILYIRYLKVAQQLVRMGRVQNFMFILGRVGSGWVTLVVGRVGSRNLDPRPTLHFCGFIIYHHPLQTQNTFSTNPSHHRSSPTGLHSRTRNCSTVLFSFFNCLFEWMIDWLIDWLMIHTYGCCCLKIWLQNDFCTKISVLNYE